MRIVLEIVKRITMKILGVKRVKFALRCQNDLKNISHEKEH